MSGAAPRSLTPSERLDWLRLARSENIGPVTFYQLLGRFGSARAALEALPDIARRGGRQKPLEIYPKAAAEREFARLGALGAKLVGWGEPDYPVALAAIDDAPPLISLRGRIPLLDKPAIAIVGARNASASGRRFARDLALQLGQHGFLVVSGMARGIDAAAHEGALPTGTAAVLAGGIDSIYPEENRDLTDAVAERGVLIAEMPVGTQPKARHFPRRNRIISGCSRGVIVVEAAFRSGSLTTARLALEQGREVFAVPGSPLDPRCRGTNDLIRRGATLLESVEDVLNTLPAPANRPLRDQTSAVFAAKIPAPADDSDLDQARRTILSLLSPTPVSVDELVRQCQLSPPVVVTVLLELELAGQIDRQAGNQVCLL
jgi:DNA processing protein